MDYVNDLPDLQLLLYQDVGNGVGKHGSSLDSPGGELIWVKHLAIYTAEMLLVTALY